MRKKIKRQQSSCRAEPPLTNIRPCVLPHPGMLPSGSSIASPECSRRLVGLSIDNAGSGAFRGVIQTGFPVRSASLLSRPDLALPQATARSGGDWEEQSHPEPRAARSFARAWRGWRAPDLPRSEHRGMLRISRWATPSPVRTNRRCWIDIGRYKVRAATCLTFTDSPAATTARLPAL